MERDLTAPWPTGASPKPATRPTYPEHVMQPLSPIHTVTTVCRTDLGDTQPQPETYTLTETSFRLEPTDRVWLGLCGITIERGNRYGDGQEYKLTADNYQADLMADAVITMIREMVSRAEPDSDAGDYCRGRAAAFLARLRSALPAAEPVA